MQGIPLQEGNTYQYQLKDIIKYAKEKAPKPPLRFVIWATSFVGILQAIGFAAVLIVCWLSTQKQMDELRLQIEEQARRIAVHEKRIVDLENRKLFPYDFQDVCPMLDQSRGLESELRGSQVFWRGNVDSQQTGQNYLYIVPQKAANCHALLYPAGQKEEQEQAIKAVKDAKEVLVSGRCERIDPGGALGLLIILKNCTLHKLK